ncbi:PREDICTED: protein TIC 62, chloroplastic-like [Camelina sativa]|uniref:Protein TIC 62, chloroplastic-like n=1 Tax=Camelina sativa TaxID=90675 RepID=A0ABM0XLS3_CAMSA|nr:PREDICTED: protein TIC 62, chloroplastic-like [Camelina sativa]
MEGTCFLRGQPPLTTIPSIPSKKGFLLQRWKTNRRVRFSGLKNHSVSGKSRSFDLSLRASGPIRASSAVTEASPMNVNSKEEDTVFVAGATGKVGSRTVRELLKLGFRVRAGVRSAQRAGSLVQSVKGMKLQNTDEGTQPVEKLEIVECDLEKKDSIKPALGKASVVICCIGASEKEISDITGPYRIDYLATKNLVDAAKSAKVNNFILVTSLGTNKFGFPAAILNLFWGVLCWKRKAEEALIESGLNYAIVRPGGMERPTDAYKETHNLTLSLDDTLFGGQVSNLQVAELLACMAKNPRLSCSKIVEVVAETTAPLTSMEKLLEKIPSKRPYVPPPKESVAAKEVKPVPTKPVTQEPTAPKEDEAPPKEKDVKPRPLSPYAAYEDLKPPTSPIPSSTTSLGSAKSKEVDATQVPVEANVVPDSISNVLVEEVKQAVEEEEVKQAVEEEEVKQTEEKKERPLSPYACYEDLKPPTSPIPSSTTSLGTAKSKEVDATQVPVEAKVVPDSISNVPVEEEEEEEEEEEVKKAVEEEVKQAEEEKQRPLSPYACYENLKPPSSPCPKASGTRKTDSLLPGLADSDTDKSSTVAPSVTETAVAPSVTETAVATSPPETAVATSPPETAVAKSAPETAFATSSPETAVATSVTETETPATPRMRPLSPYAVYDDLKPPTSPTPASTGPKKAASEITAAAEDNSELPGGNNDVLETVDGSVNTTPSSSAPEAVPVVSNVDTSLASGDNPAQPKPRPLSPYTMYEDMKPPTSPLPSPVINH